MHGLERGDQTFNAKRNHHNDKKTGQKTPDAGRRADVSIADDFFLRHRLGNLLRDYRCRKQADGFDDALRGFPR